MNITVFKNKLSHVKQGIDSLKESLLVAEKNKQPDLVDIFRDSNIQRFEYSFELSWKFMKFVLEKYESELEIRSPRQVLKAAFRTGYIDDLQAWFHMCDDRNATSHEYEEDTAMQVYKNIPKAFEQMQKFYELIQQKYEQGYFNSN
ncbi:nucleotidyltransferase substrate binding protein [Candidatus Gracilibacteria bacterium]|nr:nucleotidyltransferase substrate binding protein [Candidatus Gracilibacteria bacterium]